MSGHGYRTTTVEYYEYEMPDSRELSYEPMQPMQFPVEAGFWESYQPRSVNFQRYHQPELMDHPTMDNDHNEQNRELIYGLVPCHHHQRHTIIEYCEQEAEQLPSNDPMPNTSSYNEQDQQQANEYEAGNGDASATETDVESRKNGKKKNIYRAEEGYLVEEPTSESEEDQETKS